MSASDKQASSQIDVIWGIEDISQAIGQSFAATAYMLKKGHIPARKIGDRWAASRKALNEFFEGKAA